MELKRNLAVVSPHTKGVDVAQLQGWLKRLGYLKGEADGEYGPITGQAVYRAKFRLGYAEPDQVAGPALAKFLSGDAKVTDAMVKRAHARARQDSVRVDAQRRIGQAAVGWLGTKETPANSNHAKGITDWYMKGALDHNPWCAMFDSRCAYEAGVDFTYHYCPTIVADAKAGKNGLVIVKFAYIKTGCFAQFNWDGNWSADHTGIVMDEADLKLWAPKLFASAKRQFGAKGSSQFWTIEGNTAVGNDSNGGEVMIRLRHTSQVQAFARANKMLK